MLNGCGKIDVVEFMGIWFWGYECIFTVFIAWWTGDCGIKGGGDWGLNYGCNIGILCWGCCICWGCCTCGECCCTFLWLAVDPVWKWSKFAFDFYLEGTNGSKLIIRSSYGSSTALTSPAVGL